MWDTGHSEYWVTFFLFWTETTNCPYMGHDVTLTVVRVFLTRE